MQIRLAGIEPESIVDGPGYRFSLFTQGCPHHCPGCHNPETHDPLGGTWYDTDTIIEMISRNPMVHGVTFSGGEPMLWPEPLLEIAQAARLQGKNVWCYTGYTWEQLMNRNDPAQQALLRQIDVLVDGPYLSHERSLDILYRGSRNQRLINVPLTLKSERVCLYDPEVW